MNDELTSLSVFGLGKLGCTMLACFAHKGFSVIGVDTRHDVLDKVRHGISPIYEPGVEELLKNNLPRIAVTADAAEALSKSQVSFVIVPTPSRVDGSFSTESVELVAAEIGSVLRQKSDYHLVVITSTVLPGDMWRIRALLEKTSGKTCIKDFGLCYNPDFIALGSVVRDFLNPDLVLIGESDESAGSALEGVHLRLTDSKPSIHRMSFHNAELTKIALNSFCTLKITFANVLAEICEQMPGGDVDAVTRALGHDQRIGSKYLKGGLGYGGPCFPRDNRAFAHAADRLGVNAPLTSVTDEINNYHRTERIPALIRDLLLHHNISDGIVSVLGLTYKTDTPIVEESAAIETVKALDREGIAVRVYDPAGMHDASRELNACRHIQFAESAEACIQATSACLIATPWNQFGTLSWTTFERLMAPPAVVLDAWGLLAPPAVGSNVHYFRIGHGRNMA